MKSYNVILTFCIFILLNGSLFAWSNHNDMSRLAIENSAITIRMTAKITPFSKLLKDLNIKDALQFNLNIKIRKEYRFDFKNNEIPGEYMKVVDIVSSYTDEPDWRMDQELFGTDQYPGLWDDSFAFMGGKTDTASQAFRHMYWLPLKWTMPVKTLKVPKVFDSMGEAPDRAKIFMDLSKKAFKTDNPYWGLRFLANALHYVQDMGNPFHATQAATKLFISRALFQDELGHSWYEVWKDPVKRLTNIISYYHFSMEDFIADQMKNKGILNRELEDAIKTNSYLVTYNKDIKQAAIDMTTLTTVDSDVIGQAVMKFFPTPKVAFAELDAGKYVDKEKNPEWWIEVRNNAARDSESKKVYIESIKKVFSVIGSVTRQIMEDVMIENPTQFMIDNKFEATGNYLN